MFPGGNIKISNALNISPRLRAVPLGLKYQGIGSCIRFQKVIDESLPPQLHQLTQASAKVGYAYV